MEPLIDQEKLGMLRQVLDSGLELAITLESTGHANAARLSQHIREDMSGLSSAIKSGRIEDILMALEIPSLDGRSIDGSGGFDIDNDAMVKVKVEKLIECAGIAFDELRLLE
ncbi:MAG: hypothetical protein MUC58_02465 [Rhizobiaceae bacterium]|jgi:hypothetical protein|nr:hypothetical protein [Rhizobiaceae bacterium]